MHDGRRLTWGAHAVLPEGTVTFLLTDVEGSTRLWENTPDAMTQAIGRHYEILDEAIARHGGMRPEEQGEGDSVVAVFTDAATALDAAIDAQRAMEAEAWPAPISALRIRMALHSGQSVKRNAANYMGPTIIRCARVRACGHGGQILLSDATAALVRTRLPADVMLQPLGAHRLKDLDSPEHVHQVVAPGLTPSFPPLRSLLAGRHNLPLQATALIGREPEVAEVVDLSARSRVVTLTGSGGVGKTRLALQIAAETFERYDGGVWWVDLATINDSEAVAASVLSAVGGAQQPLTPALDQLVVVLEPETSILVVLDNCEHVADGCARVIDAVIATCPGVSFLSTSREPVGVAGEITWRVSSLTLPPDHPIGVDDVDRFAALSLFWDRAWRARPQLVLTDALVEAGARICRRLDGIPLAIELAAARCRQLSPERIANELDEHYRLLVGGGRTHLARQRTLEASVDWSHRLLAADEKVAFRRLAVFVGWFPLAAAEGVTASFGDIDEWAVLDLVARLVDKSLIVVDDDTDPAEPRYRLLETVRFFALERARDANELEPLRDAHARWWSDWISRLDPHLYLTAVIPELDAWYPNLRAALHWVANDLDRAVPFVRGLGPYMINRDRLDDVRFAITIARALDRAGHPRWQMVVSRLSLAAIMVGEIDFIFDAVSRALESAVADGDHASALECLHGLAFLDRSGQQFAEMARHAALAGRPDESAMGRIAYSFLDGEPLPTSAADVEHLIAASRSLDPYVNFVARQARTEILTAQGALATARAESCQAAALVEALPMVSAPNEYMTLSLSAYLDLMQRETIDLDRILIRRRDRIFRGVPSYWSGIWISAIDIAASHLRGQALDVDLVEAALASTMTDSGSSIIRLIVGELLDRGRVESVRAALARFREVPFADHSFRRLVHDCFEAHLVVAEGDAGGGERLLRDVLPRLLEQGAVPLTIDVLESLAVLAAPTSPTRAVRLLHATQSERDAIGYRFRFPNHQRRVDRALVGGDAKSAEETPMALADAVAFALRPHGRRNRPTLGWTSLTPTERDIARLVAEGATNPMIAKKLSMTVNTVKTHLSHIFTKLDIASRAQLASLATQHC